jgi:CubicO group peptidase (beta-lactamase class C family)
MAKTITAMLVGIAIDEGRIRSINDRPDTYVPELAGTEYGRTPILHLLTMSSGVKFIENYFSLDSFVQGDFARGRGDWQTAALRSMQPC